MTELNESESGNDRPLVEEPVLAVRDLTVAVSVAGRSATVVEGVTFEIKAGEALGMVGESGSGKSMSAMAIMRMLPPGASVVGGEVVLEGENVTSASEASLRRLRGGHVGTIFQDPLASLNPLMTVGAQIVEALRLHGTGRRAARERAAELLSVVGIKDPKKSLDAHPHQFSGGMRQRVMIAIAVANSPRLVIADEPTTALDVTIQAEILELLRTLREELGTALLLISHDIGVVEQVCDRLVVLYGGRIAETGRCREVLSRPQHPYTYQLMRARPRIDVTLERLSSIPGGPPVPGQLLQGCRFAPRCELREDRCELERPQLTSGAGAPDHLAACFVVNDEGRTLTSVETTPARAVSAGSTTVPEPSEVHDRGRPVVEVDEVRVIFRSGRRRSDRKTAVDGVTLRAFSGHVLGVVGESGSGKSTVAKTMVGLVTPVAGSVLVNGVDWRRAPAEERRGMRQAVQLVFQDPYASLNPRWRVRHIVGEALRNDLGQSTRDEAELLDLVGLSRSYLDSYPDELSGGQRQRVGIARALAVNPQILVADEPVSALDVSVQAKVINLFADIRRELNVGLVFVSHDLAVVRHISDHVAVMSQGKIVEEGSPEHIFEDPRDPYTIRLIEASPSSRLGLPA